MGKRTLKRPIKVSDYGPHFPKVVGEPVHQFRKYPQSNIVKFANINRINPTSAERAFDVFLWGLDHGVLRGRYETQHVISGKWIVDFFFPENRLAIEIDGSIHLNAEQKEKDRLKKIDCARFDITLIRITNTQVFGSPEQLLSMVIEGLREAAGRENKIIGKIYKGV